MLTLEGLVLLDTAQSLTLGACISFSKNVIVLVLKTPWGLLSKESTPVACLIQLEGTLMSMLGYIVKAIGVSQARIRIHVIPVISFPIPCVCNLALCGTYVSYDKP